MGKRVSRRTFLRAVTLFEVGWGTVRCRRCRASFTQPYSPSAGKRLSRTKESPDA